MEYHFQNSVDDFRVKYTLVIPEKEHIPYQISDEEQSLIDELENAYTDIEYLTNQADGCDYVLSVTSGMIAGLIDSFFVEEWDFRYAKKKSNIEINNKILGFAKKDPRYNSWCDGVGKSNRWNKRDPNRLASAVEFLEEKYVLPGDNDWKFKGSGISPKTHHLDDFCHHPTIIGMICCILVQFTGTAKYHSVAQATNPIPVTVNEYGCFVSDKAYGRVFAGIINWFFNVARTIENQEGHLMSDMAGSINSVKNRKSGAGVPGTVMSILKELSILPIFKEKTFAEDLRKAYQNGIGNGNGQLDLGIYNYLFEGASSKFDMRTELAVKHELNRQKNPVIINEIVVRSFYFIRRFIEQMKGARSLMELDWKRLFPMKNRTIVRMMTISSGVFCLVDLGDAAITAGMESGGNLSNFFGKFILKVNFVGIGRFTLAVSSDLYMEARKGRIEMAIASGEIAVAAIKEKKMISETLAINTKTEHKVEKMKYTADEVKKLFN